MSRLKALGIVAAAYQADASDPAAIRRAVASARMNSGRSPPCSGPHSETRRQECPRDSPGRHRAGIRHRRRRFAGGVQSVLEDLKSSAGASILVANGALGENTTEADGYAKYLDNDGVALENAAKSKLVGILAERLRESTSMLAKVTIAGSVAGTATAGPSAISPKRIADRFWALTQTRDTTRRE
ncbi:MAG: hypothetical protein WDM88_10235 [Galbitalea sp.]